MTPLRRLIAGLSLTAATLGGTLAATTPAAATTPPDTAWGAPAPDDPHCCLTPATPEEDGSDGSGGPSVTPLDTAWG